MLRGINRQAQAILTKLAEVKDEDVRMGLDDRLRRKCVAADHEGWRAAQVGDELSANCVVPTHHQRRDANSRCTRHIAIAGSIILHGGVRLRALQASRALPSRHRPVTPNKVWRHHASPGATDVPTFGGHGGHVPSASLDDALSRDGVRRWPTPVNLRAADPASAWYRDRARSGGRGARRASWLDWSCFGGRGDLQPSRPTDRTRRHHRLP